MEEKALLVNIATIIAKDMILDKKVKFRTSYNPLYQFQHFLEDDDDGLDLFVYEMQQNKKLATAQVQKNLDISDFDEDDAEEACIDENYLIGASSRRQELKLHLAQELTGTDFEKNFHLKKETFTKLIREVGPMIKNHMRDINGRIISKESFISLALWKLATDEHFEEISRRFKVPLDICYWSVNNFCNMLSDSLAAFIRWPKSGEENSIAKGFNKDNDHKFPNLFGVIGTRRLDVFLETQDEEISIIMQVVCTSDQIFTECHLELASNYSFSESSLGKKLKENVRYIPSGCYMIGDASFPLKSYLITPFNDPDDEQKRKFNKLIAEKHQIVENALSKMMQRFHALYSLEAKNLKEIKNCAKTICTLHNYCRKQNDSYVVNFKHSQIESNLVRGKEIDLDGIRKRKEIMEIVCPMSSHQ